MNRNILYELFPVKEISFINKLKNNKKLSFLIIRLLFVLLKNNRTHDVYEFVDNILCYLNASYTLKAYIKRLIFLKCILLNDDIPLLYGLKINPDLQNCLNEEYNFLLEETPKLIQKEFQELQN